MSLHGVTIRLTKHARIKIAERNISLDTIKNVILSPAWRENDRFDSSLTHLIGKIEGRFLRVIGRWEGENEFVVISAFYDRRLKRREQHD
jgi:hypothetical protein